MFKFTHIVQNHTQPQAVLHTLWYMLGRVCQIETQELYSKMVEFWRSIWRKLHRAEKITRALRVVPVTNMKHAASRGPQQHQHQKPSTVKSKTDNAPKASILLRINQQKKIDILPNYLWNLFLNHHQQHQQLSNPRQKPKHFISKTKNSSSLTNWEQVYNVGGICLRNISSFLFSQKTCLFQHYSFA